MNKDYIVPVTTVKVFQSFTSCAKLNTWCVFRLSSAQVTCVSSLSANFYLPLSMSCHLFTYVCQCGWYLGIFTLPIYSVLESGGVSVECKG